ncbi:PIN domain-containing protein [Dyadobacter sp. 3J3]|uniref:PIN domain-containing protein n=1 Tax=Dyadobacter sp. 3J3 TaxID=2606600 RepID=UPI00190F50A9
MSNEIVDKTIDLRKKSRIKLPDAIVAATAIIYNYTLITRNISDFKNIKGLTLINLYDL